jgi:transposase
VAIDPAAPYAAPSAPPACYPTPRLWSTTCTLVTLANDALTSVRRWLTWDLKDHRGRKTDPEWANRRRPLTARERLSHNNFTNMSNALVAEDPSAQITRCRWWLPESAARDSGVDGRFRCGLH